MNTKQCPYCSEKIQIEAIKCRFCGEFLDNEKKNKSEKEKYIEEKTEYALKKNKLWFKRIFLAIAVFLMLKMAFTSSSKENTSSGEEKECPPVGTVINSYYGHCPENFQKLLLLKNSMKDPSSFEVISTEQLGGRKLSVKYRATNGFGAKVTETKTLY